MNRQLIIAIEQLNQDVMVKSFIRYCLACEHGRHPIRRSSEQVQSIMKGHARAFNKVFTEAQKQLREVFGMELVEMPVKEKVTISQKRAAAKNDKSGSNKVYILKSVLPQEYRVKEIIGGALEGEAAYMGFVTTIVTAMYLNGRVLSESKLDKHLERLRADMGLILNAHDKKPMSMVKILEKMEKQGYIQKVKDTTGGDVSIEYHIGPRAKVEIGEKGVIEMVKTTLEANGKPIPEDLEARVRKSMGADESAAAAATQAATQGTERAERGRRNEPAPRGTQGRSRRQDASEEEEEDEEGEEDSE